MRTSPRPATMGTRSASKASLACVIQAHLSRTADSVQGFDALLFKCTTRKADTLRYFPKHCSYTAALDRCARVMTWKWLLHCAAECRQPAKAFQDTMTAKACPPEVAGPASRHDARRSCFAIPPHDRIKHTAAARRLLATGAGISCMSALPAARSLRCLLTFQAAICMACR